MEFDHSTDTISPDDQTVITIGGTGGLVLPIGTTLQRPGASNGVLRYNTDTAAVDVVVNGVYQSMRGVTTFIPAAVTAVGTTQGSGPVLSASYSTVSTSAGNTSVNLPASPTVGQQFTLFNDSALRTVLVFPATGGRIGSAAINNSYSLNPRDNVVLFAVSSTQWEVVGTNARPTTVGGLDSQVLYNNGGDIGGDPTFIFDDVTKLVGITGTLSLVGTASPVLLNASAGTSGQVLTSAGAGATPTWTTVSGGSGYTTIQDEGTPLTARTTINFTGAGVTASDSGSVTTVTIAGGSGAVSGTATLNFGAAPGTNVVTVTVNTASVSTSSRIQVWVAPVATASHNAYEHSMVPIALTAGTIVNGVSFVITGVCEWRLTGLFSVYWSLL